MGSAEEKRNAWGILVGKPEGKRPLGRPKRRWEDNIDRCLKGTSCENRECEAGGICEHGNDVKRGNQQDATNSMFIIKLFISTRFGHHYAHQQENKTVSYCMRCSALGV